MPFATFECRRMKLLFKRLETPSDTRRSTVIPLRKKSWTFGARRSPPMCDRFCEMNVSTPMFALRLMSESSISVS